MPHPGLAWLATIIGTPQPANLKSLFDIILLLLVLETVTSWWRSYVCKEAHRPSLLLRFITATLQSWTLLVIAGATCLALDSWIEMQGACWILIAILSLSLLRTIVALQLCGGMDFGPARPLLDRLGNLLLVQKLGESGAKPPDEGAAT